MLIDFLPNPCVACGLAISPHSSISFSSKFLALVGSFKFIFLCRSCRVAILGTSRQVSLNLFFDLACILQGGIKSTSCFVFVFAALETLDGVVVVVVKVLLLLLVGVLVVFGVATAGFPLAVTVLEGIDLDGIFSVLEVGVEPLLVTLLMVLLLLEDLVATVLGNLVLLKVVPLMALDRWILDSFSVISLVGFSDRVLRCSDSLTISSASKICAAASRRRWALKLWPSEARRAKETSGI